MAVEFNKEEISRIEKSLGFIIFDWAKHLINHIITQARNSGVSTVYMNTTKTLNAGAITDPKMEYFYSKLPPILGFYKTKANLRDRGNEDLWAYSIDRMTASGLNTFIRLAKNITLEELPKTYQGAFIGILGKKEYYTSEDIKRVLEIIEKKKSGNKSKSRFFYDWGSREWSGGQRFRDDITENVVLQKLPSEVQEMVHNDPALLKFWSLVLSQHQHFGNDVIGFALISKINKSIWLINEIQTDAINAYMKLRRIDKEQSVEKKGVTFEVLKDMLTAQNRSNWIAILEGNEALRNQILSNPNMIGQLPDNSVDLNSWISENRQQMIDNGMDLQNNLARYFQAANFNVGIFRVY